MIQKEKSIVQQLLPHLIAILCFFAVTFGYFSPQLDGKVLMQSDAQQYKGMSHELGQYYDQEHETSAWTGSMFSGMPSYQIGVWGGSPNFLNYLEAPLKVLGYSSAGSVFAGMLMAYILFCMMGVGVIPAILGAIAYSLSSYNIIIIDAGHITKAWAIAYLPLIISSFAAAFKRKYLFTGLLMALGLALQIKNNHLQITYYTAILCVFLYIGLVIEDVLKKNLSGLCRATGALAIGVIIAVLCNLGNIYSNYEMSKESIRGKSELSQPTQSEKQSSGLDKDYAFAWSYGKSETLSLLIPDINGGASGGKLSTESHLYKAIRTQAPQAQLDADGIQAQTYWGDQPFTSGPVYFGAVICFLFVLGMLVIKNPLKWVLFAATIFFILLSWGKNLEGFNDWFFYHFPLYSKFRAVSTALVIPAITMLIIAVWGLKVFLDKKVDSKILQTKIFISLGITGGICLLAWIAPGIFGFNFTAISDQQWISQVPDWYYKSLIADRKDLLSSDAIRSLIYILLAGGILLIVTKAKTQKNVTIYCSALLVLFSTIDLWGVDKRYLNNDSFETKQNYNIDQPFPQTAADKVILQDKNPSYRVLNLNNPFNETKTSYYHKSIGGYHAAKLKRYQELIDYNLQGEINTIINSFSTQNIDSVMASFRYTPTLNMLNAKYIIFAPDQPPLQNSHVMGNGWFVDNYIFVDNADQEIATLKTTDLTTTAIIDKKFEKDLSGLKIIPDSTATIELVSYKPNILKYKTSTQAEQLAVLSEMYYANGWEAYIDGKPVPYICADWTLRALRIPAGNHDVEFKFVPTGYNKARKIETASSGILILAIIGSIIFYIRRKEKTK